MTQHSKQTTIPGTEAAKSPKKPSSTQWLAFVVNKTTQIPTVLSSKYQIELKKQLNELENYEVVKIVKGKTFETKIKTSFDFVA